MSGPGVKQPDFATYSSSLGERVFEVQGDDENVWKRARLLRLQGA
jgi:hypothetical protein